MSLIESQRRPYSRDERRHMFTGIITHRGTIVSRNSSSLEISVPKGIRKDLPSGSSLSVNGVCLTVTQLTGGAVCTHIMPETWKETALGTLLKGDQVNLELPVSINGLFQGHIVQGHIDGVAEVISIKKEANSKIITYKSAENLTRFMVPKGSIAIDGISLTLISVSDETFCIGIIPYTNKNTNMQSVTKGTKSNIETDIMAKYVAKLCQKGIYGKTN